MFNIIYSLNRNIIQNKSAMLKTQFFQVQKIYGIIPSRLSFGVAKSKKILGSNQPCYCQDGGSWFHYVIKFTDTEDIQA